MLVAGCWRPSGDGWLLATGNFHRPLRFSDCGRTGPQGPVRRGAL